MEKAPAPKTVTFGPPFIPKHALFHSLHKPTTSNHTNPLCLASTSAKLPDRLPGHPQTRLTQHDLAAFLRRDLTTPKLDRFYHYLWLVAAAATRERPINTLTHQQVRGRDVTVSQNPELHCVWHDKRIFVKPMPAYLLSYDFWDAVFTEEWCATDEGRLVVTSALGFMRSYGYLVQHPSDFAIAVDKGLIPENVGKGLAEVREEEREKEEGEDKAGKKAGEKKEPAKISFEDFVAFIDWFGSAKIGDDQVSLRYHYGDLRLSRLNFWAKFVLKDFTFEKAYGNYDAYFSRFYGPLLFTFGVINLIMGSINLAINTEKGGWKKPDWKHLYDVGNVFAIIVLVFICCVGLTLVSLFSFMALKEIMYAVKEHRRKLERALGIFDEEKGKTS
ncbi:uncharacterized protein BKCO1_37000167 [Diplodia corticola]|uniref:Subtilisin-like serine protease n=1 Tax=Diplodia corticola TaxID=236234 RepID=A0A1J9RXV5_9PEZI|nr:uncharacterized protein BKCO1_37000167 [Diplodia corticola]OJD32652.1 hypothetical protein BKCO1_37000167 [Diplodia corticola]